jgi:hypothetical protein
MSPVRRKESFENLLFFVAPSKTKLDALVESPKTVIPAKAGIHK